MVHTAWSSAGRALHVSGARGQAMTNYFASAAAPALYAAHGALREAQWGNGLWERWEYLPERLQPWRVQVGSATQASSKGEWQFGYCEGSWGLSCASNNGNIVGQKILPANVTQVYSFDALNRISTASESGGGWLETYGFDVHGNLWWNSRSASLGGPHLMRPDSAAWFANGRNRALKPGELEAESFDAAGNLTKAGVLRLEYDGENRLAKAVGSGSTTYEYDGLGRRVTKREAGGTLTYYVYDAFGGLAAEYLPTGPSSPAGTHYLSTDHLGSTRLVTNANGDVVSRHDYLPFGEEIPNTVGNRQSVAGYAWNGSLTQRFTGKERDAETGLDYFLARFMASAQGRFASPDPYTIQLEMLKGRNDGERQAILDQYLSSAQVWNKYSYVLNNPLAMTDPDGRRAFTQNEQDAIDRLRKKQESARAAGDAALAGAIGAAITEITTNVETLADNAPGSEGFRAAIWAIKNIGNANYGKSGIAVAPGIGPIRPGAYKCNIFCAAAYGYGAGRQFPAVRSALGGLVKYPPVANELGDPGKRIPNLEVVGSPGLGDLVLYPSGNPAYLGHSAVYLGGGLVAYASDQSVKLNTVSRTQQQLGYTAPLVYRRYKP